MATTTYREFQASLSYPTEEATEWFKNKAKQNKTRLSDPLVCLRVYSRSQTFPPSAKPFPRALLTYLPLQQTKEGTHFWAEVVGVHKLCCPFHLKCTGMISFKTKFVNKWKILPNVVQAETEPRSPSNSNKKGGTLL